MKKIVKKTPAKKPAPKKVAAAKKPPAKKAVAKQPVVTKPLSDQHNESLSRLLDRLGARKAAA